jgi:hypothetical protein
MPIVTTTWYRVTTPGKQDQVVKIGSAALKKALADESPGRPTVAKIASPGSYSEAQVKALGLPKSATKEDKNP